MYNVTVDGQLGPTDSQTDAVHDAVTQIHTLMPCISLLWPDAIHKLEGARGALRRCRNGRPLSSCREDLEKVPEKSPRIVNLCIRNNMPTRMLAPLSLLATASGLLIPTPVAQPPAIVQQMAARASSLDTASLLAETAIFGETEATSIIEGSKLVMPALEKTLKDAAPMLGGQSEWTCQMEVPNGRAEMTCRTAAPPAVEAPAPVEAAPAMEMAPAPEMAPPAAVAPAPEAFTPPPVAVPPPAVVPPPAFEEPERAMVRAPEPYVPAPAPVSPADSIPWAAFAIPFVVFPAAVIGFSEGSKPPAPGSKSDEPGLDGKSADQIFNAGEQPLPIERRVCNATPRLPSFAPTLQRADHCVLCLPMLPHSSVQPRREPDRLDLWPSVPALLQHAAPARTDARPGGGRLRRGAEEGSR